MDDVEAEYPTAPRQFPPSGPNSLASIGQRFVARVVDGIVLLGPFLLVVIPFYDADDPESFLGPTSPPVLVLLVAQVLYEALLTAWRGQTVGKATLGIRVARLVDGRNPSLAESTIRVMFPVAVGAIPIVGILGLVIYLMALAHPLRQGWHDRAAATVVVRTR